MQKMPDHENQSGGDGLTPCLCGGDGRPEIREGGNRYIRFFFAECKACGEITLKHTTAEGAAREWNQRMELKDEAKTRKEKERERRNAAWNGGGSGVLRRR